MTAPLKPADFVLIHGHGLQEAIIQRGTGSWWNHAILVLNAQGLCLEATGGGVAFCDINKYAAAEREVVSSPLDDDGRSEACVWANAQIGKPYDRLAIAGIVLTRLFHSNILIGVDATMICSGLIAKALEHGGYIFPGDAEHVSPADLARLFHASKT